MQVTFKAGSKLNTLTPNRNSVTAKHQGKLIAAGLGCFTLGKEGESVWKLLNGKLPVEVNFNAVAAVAFAEGVAFEVSL